MLFCWRKNTEYFLKWTISKGNLKHFKLSDPSCTLSAIIYLAQLYDRNFGATQS